MNINNILSSENCSCGKRHTAPIDDIIIEKGALKRIPECISRYNSKKPFVVADVNTYNAAGGTVCKTLEEKDIAFVKYIFKNKELKPDEEAVGSAVMHFTKDCDIIIGIGSGVINDICKILANVTNLPYIIVATAPSMDGYASDSSSMTRDGVKISLPSKSADIIIGDIDILKNAPLEMAKSGLGDMVAKYVSICEWRISHIITGEYYCEEVAELVRKALKKCVDNAEGLLKHDEEAVSAIFEGLVMSGLAMSYAGV
ncbi:MAG: iron-containing alcohol dehydrogenase, partial [Acutalibacteraceae bacterium]